MAGLRNIRRFHADSRRSPRRHRDRRSHRGSRGSRQGGCCQIPCCTFLTTDLQRFRKSRGGGGWPWVEIQPGETEGDRVARSLAVPVRAHHPLDPHDSRVHRLRPKIGRHPLEHQREPPRKFRAPHLSTRGSRRSGDRPTRHPHQREPPQRRPLKPRGDRPTVIPTRGSRRSGDRSNHAATAQKRPTAPPFRCAVGPLCFDCSASRRNNLPLFPRVRRCAGPPEIPPRGVPRSGLVSGRFPFRRSLATRSSDASPSLFTSARLQVPQPEGLRTRACP